MNMMTMIYTSAMEESVAFYETLGLTRDGDGAVDEWWNQFTIGGAVLALHKAEDANRTFGGNPELHVNVAADQLDAIYAACKDAGYAVAEDIIHLEDMGMRTFHVTDPNGVKVFING